MDALAERVEVLAAVRVADHDLAVEHVAPGREHELREVAPERLAASRLQEQLLAVHEGKAAKAVELDLVAVLLPLGKRPPRKRQLGLQRRLDREAHMVSRGSTG